MTWSKQSRSQWRRHNATGLESSILFPGRFPLCHCVCQYRRRHRKSSCKFAAFDRCSQPLHGMLRPEQMKVTRGGNRSWWRRAVNMRISTSLAGGILVLLSSDQRVAFIGMSRKPLRSAALSLGRLDSVRLTLRFCCAFVMLTSTASARQTKAQSALSSHRGNRYDISYTGLIKTLCRLGEVARRVEVMMDVAQRKREGTMQNRASIASELSKTRSSFLHQLLHGTPGEMIGGCETG